MSLLLGMPPAAAQPATAQPTAAQPAAAPPIPTQVAVPALARTLPPRMAAGQALVVAVALGGPPDDYRDESGALVGWEIDILRAATEALGIGLDLRPTTFDTLIPSLQSRRVDAALGRMGINTMLEKIVDMVGTLVADELFAALADTASRIDSLDDLCGVSVATTVRSWQVIHAEQQQARCSDLGRKPIETLAYSDGSGAAEALMAQRAGLLWLGSTAIAWFVAQSKGRAKVVGHHGDRSTIGIALPKGSDMAAPLQAAIQHLLDDGTYALILRKWSLEDGAVTAVLLNPALAPR